jgi:hypothetical protein
VSPSLLAGDQAGKDPFFPRLSDDVRAPEREKRNENDAVSGTNKKRKSKRAEKNPEKPKKTPKFWFNTQFKANFDALTDTFPTGDNDDEPWVWQFLFYIRVGDNGEIIEKLFSKFCQTHCPGSKKKSGDKTPQQALKKPREISVKLDPHGKKWCENITEAFAAKMNGVYYDVNERYLELDNLYPRPRSPEQQAAYNREYTELKKHFGKSLHLKETLKIANKTFADGVAASAALRVFREDCESCHENHANPCASCAEALGEENLQKILLSLGFCMSKDVTPTRKKPVACRWLCGQRGRT